MNTTQTAAAPYAAPAAQVSLPTLAHQQAATDAAAQIHALQVQQQQLIDQGAVRAQQIQLASQAAAQMQQGIGQQTQAGYQSAAKDLAGIAGGYSGALQGTAQDAANKVVADLQAVGAPTSQYPTGAQPLALGNLLYGVGGQIPASVLENSGAAFMAAQNQLPAETLGVGLQQGAAARNTGAADAQQLASQIVAAQAGIGPAEHSYLQDLLAQQSANRSYQLAQGAARREGAAQVSGAKRDQAYLDEVKSLIKGRTESTRIGFIKAWGFDPVTGRPAAGYQKAPGGGYQKIPAPQRPLIIGSDKTGRYAVDLATGKTTMVTAPVQTVTRPVIVGSDKTGRYALNPETGTMTLIVPPVKGSGNKGGVTPGEKLSLLNRGNRMAENFFYGVPAHGTTPAVAAVLYPNALRRLVAVGMSVATATRLLNAYYEPGVGGRPHEVNPAVDSSASGPVP